MRILIVSDFHYALPQFDWLVQAAPNYDLVIFAGDMLDTNSYVDPGTQSVVILKYLERIAARTRLVVCSGNHDLDADDGPDGERHAGWLSAVGRFAVPFDGETIDAGEMLITICPWWDGPMTQRRIGEQFDAAATQRGDRPWVWVYHAPPPDSPISWSGERHFGDPALSGWIVRHQPDFVVCGHVHEAPFARNGSWVDRIGSSWVFNPGRQIGDVPTTIALDTQAREAAWFSLEGAESVKLDAPLTRPIEPLMAMPSWMGTARAANP